jgi:isoleucyl-tRNA synthetase
MFSSAAKFSKFVDVRSGGLVEDFSYVPGWDCHGLPVEHNALKQLGVSLLYSFLPVCTEVFTKSDPHSLPASVIRSKAAEFAKNEIQVQKEEFRQLGIMADWDSSQFTYRTLGESYIVVLNFLTHESLIDHEYEIRQLRIFQQMVDKGI